MVSLNPNTSCQAIGYIQDTHGCLCVNSNEGLGKGLVNLLGLGRRTPYSGGS